jgi:hypothetical protein
MHAASELREWFLEWLDGDNGRFDDEAVAKLKELGSCTDELPADYCSPESSACLSAFPTVSRHRRSSARRIDEKRRFVWANRLA